MRITLIIFFFVICAHGQTILINEFMSKNDLNIQDEDGDFADWIELYNTTSSTINLLNYHLSYCILDL